MLSHNLHVYDIQAAVGLSQMEKISHLIRGRRNSVRRYLNALGSVSSNLILPESGDAAGCTFQSFVTRVRRGGRSRRNSIMATLAAKGVQTHPGTHAVHRLGYYADKYGLPADLFSNASLAEDTTIALPIVPNMRAADQDRVIEILLNAL